MNVIKSTIPYVIAAFVGAITVWALKTYTPLGKFIPG